MRVVGLLIVVVCAACQAPGYGSAGASWFHPDLGHTGETDGELLTTAAVAFKSDIGYGGRFTNPVPADAPEDRRGLYLEGFTAYGADVLGSDFAMIGAGPRLRFGSRGQCSLRGGLVYARANGGETDLGGPYVGVGYDIYLNEAQTWSFTPEATLYGLFGTDDESLACSAGISLTYHWSGRGTEAK